MRNVSPPRLAFACACAGAAVVLAAQLALARAPFSRAEALSLDALASAAVLGLAACALGVFAREPLRVRLGLGASALGGWRTALAALGLVGLSHAAEAALALAGLSSAGLVRFDDALQGLGPADLVLAFVGLALASAVGEEIFFRGLLQRGLAARVGTPVAIAAAALAFGAAHGDWIHGAAACVLGAYLGITAARGASIRPAIAAHALNNAVALFEKASGLALPEGPIATPGAVFAGVTLACVGMGALLRRARPGAALQSLPGPADAPGGP